MSRARLFVAAIVADLCIVVSALAIPPESASRDPDGAIHEALRSRAYAQTVELIDAELPRAEKDAREYLLFRAGLALLYGGQPEPALQRFDQQLAEFPAGRWADKAHFRQADAHVALKQFDAAEQIYAERVRALVGDARKAEIAQVYLKFADEYFTPHDPLIKPDYEKARAFYARALDLEPGEALRDELLVKQADCARLLGKWDEAIPGYESYLLGFDPDYRAARKERAMAAALPSPALQPGKNIVRARLELARCRLAKNQPADARRECQDLLALLAKLDPDRAQQRSTWIEATYLISKTYSFPQPADAEALTSGVQVLHDLIEAFPLTAQAFEAGFDIGGAYAHLGRYEDALAAFDGLIKRTQALAAARVTDPNVPKRAAELSQEALFTVGQLHFGQKKYADAIRTWNEYVAKYPSGPHWSQAQQAVVDAEHQIGADAFEKEDFAAARAAWTAFLDKYPLDRRAAGTLYGFGEMAYREQTKREKANEKPDWNAPIAEWRRLVTKYPQSEEAGQAQFMIARIYEEKLLNFETALAEYQKLTWSKAAPAAKARIDEMNATRLIVRTERVFRTNEPAKVRVDARNVEKLTVKLYRIDMRDYFRKRHNLGNVEALDLFLIDPDTTLEVPVDGFAKYKPCTQELEIPFDGPGVYAVNVSNDASQSTTAAGTPREKIEATTLLVRSDIDVIIKSSRRQVLVFAQDMVKQTPAGGVDVLVSNGEKVVLSGKTGDDGVWLGKLDRPEAGAPQVGSQAGTQVGAPTSGRLPGRSETGAPESAKYQAIAVLAERSGHVAGNALALEGLEFSKGLASRGYIYTDRPVYRPGDAVNIRGILREIKDGQYVVPTQPEDVRLRWKLDVVDAKGRVLRTEELRLSEFGSFATQFRVAEDGPVGPYKLIARRVEGPTFAGEFAVQTYELPKAVLAFDLAEPVVQRGEKIKGSLVLKYAYGEAVVGKTVEYSLTGPAADDKIARVGVTDADGKIAFEFDTAVFSEETPVLLQARQADLDVGADARVFVAVRAFRAGVKVPRPLYLSEEPVEITVETKNLKGEPIAQEMTVTALRITRTRDCWSETKVESQPVKTDAKDGRGRATFKLAEGGEYRLRVEGPDRFGHVVTAEATVQISDDQDRTRIRLFSDRQHYKVGEKIAVDIHSRLESEPEAEARGKEPRASARAIVGAQGASVALGEPSYLALITYEGEEIIGYRTLKLAKGHNPLELPVENAHFPNFAIGVSVMAGDRFHQASREFTVERQLNIALKTDQQIYRPRDEMSVEVAVTDQQGQPVQAEVGLAMIDNALLSRYPDGTPNIVWFFQTGAERQAALRTDTSCTFRYLARTRAMVTELLAEARREELAKERAYGNAAFAAQPSAATQPAATPLQSVAGGATRVIQLRNAHAKQMRENLAQLFQPLRKGPGSADAADVRITADEGTNSLIVAGDPWQVDVAAQIAGELDATPATDLDTFVYAPRYSLGTEFDIQDLSADGVAGLPFVSYGAQIPPPFMSPSSGDSLEAAVPVFFTRRAVGGGLYGQQGAQYRQKRFVLGTLTTAAEPAVPWDVNVLYPKNWAELSGVGNDATRDSAGSYRGGSVTVQAAVADCMRTIALQNIDAKEAERLINQLNLRVRNAPPRSYFPDVAYWNPRTVTDAAGKATVKIIVPDSSTTWKLVARGVTPQTLCGHGEAQVVSKHDFFVEILTPPTVVEGDESRPRAAVHCLTPYDGKVDVELTARREKGIEGTRDQGIKGATLSQQTRTVEVKGAGTYEVEFDPVTLKEPGVVVLEATAKTQSEVPAAKRVLADATAQRVHVTPWGMRIEAHAAGVGKDTDFIEIELPRGDSQPGAAGPQGSEPGAAGPQAAGAQAAASQYHDLRLTIAVGPSMQRWLIEEALESGPRWAAIESYLAGSRIAPPRTHADTASVLLATLYAADYIRSQNTADTTAPRADQNRDREGAVNTAVAPGGKPSPIPSLGGRGVTAETAVPPAVPPSVPLADQSRDRKGADGPADVLLLNERAAGLIAQLLAAQHEKGGWTWCGQAGDPDPWTTAYVGWALGKARAEGLAVPDAAVQKLTAYLKQVFADARTEQTELKAVVLHGLSWLEPVDFAHANRLYRNRETLSAAALAHLALTFVRLDRNALAADLLGVLEHRMKEVPTSRGLESARSDEETSRGLESARSDEEKSRGLQSARCLVLPNDTNSAWMSSELEVTALALLAQLSVDPRSTNVPPLVEYLTRSGRADGWRPHKAKGAVVAALATYYARAQQAAANYELTVSVNGRALRNLKVAQPPSAGSEGETGSIRVDLSDDELRQAADVGHGGPTLQGKQRIDFVFKGRGEYAYAITLSGFTKEFPKPPARPDRILRADDRRVEPPLLEYKGRVVKAGFSTAQKFDWFANTAKNLPVGAVASVTVNVWRETQIDNAAGDRDYVIVKETIPAGFRLLRDAVQGGFQTFDYADNVLTLYFGSRRDLGTFHYQMVAATPGTYRLPPTLVRSLYRPEVFAVNKVDQVLTVLPRGTPSPDQYKYTPDELFTLGKLYYEDGEYETATKHLKQLLAADWLLHDQPYREAVHVLLLAALARQDADGIVNYFEILKERYPDLVIPFEQIVQVADAYARTGQAERAYLIYRATADASFVRESQVAGALQGEGWFLESVDFLESLWRAYPDTPQVESICYAISQTVYAKAPQADKIKPRRLGGMASLAADSTTKPDGSSERARPWSSAATSTAGATARAFVTREELIRAAIGQLERFLALYPESPIADEASYSLAAAYLDLDDFKTAIARTERFSELFPKSKWLDRYRYIQALAYFHLGDFERARTLAEQVAAATYRDEQGVERPSPNKWLALYIIGQIYHAQNQTAKALEYYKQVKEQFGDAGEAVSEFERKFIRLPEVAIFHPDQRGFLEAEEWDKALRAERAGRGNTPAGAEPSPGPSLGGRGVATGAPPDVAAGLRTGRSEAQAARWYKHPFAQLDYRNIKSAVLQVYRVDLLKLALVEKNLTEITAVNLAGISPLVEKTVPLGEGLDYIDKALRIELDKIAPPTGTAAEKAENRSGTEGAYLVICRGDELFTSGLVLVTPLALEVQEDVGTQRTRIRVVDAITRDGRKDVHVKVIGTGMSTFVNGDTDLRGVFTAEGVSGFPTAVARDAAGHFAFYRSEAVLALAGMPKPEMMQQQAAGKPATGEKVGKADYLFNVQSENRQIQAGNEVILDQLYKQQQKGVEVKKSH